MRAMYLSLKFVAIALAVLTILMAPDRNDDAEAGNPAELELDFEISDGACVDVDSTTSVIDGGSFQVAVCLTNPIGNDVGAFNFVLQYNDTLILAPEVADANPALDDNPDANVGSTTFTSGSFPNDLGPDWACQPPYPKGDNEPAVGDGNGRAFLSCFNAVDPDGFTEGPLAVVAFNALAPGAASIILRDAAVSDDTFTELGSCNPTIEVAMTCTGGTATVTGSALALDFNISDGACVDIDPTATVTAGLSFQVAVCLANSDPEDVIHFVTYIEYNDTIVRAPEVADSGTALDDNPDANVGATTFTSPTYPNTLGTPWTCGPGFPKGDLDASPGSGTGTAFIACQFDSGVGTLDEGPLSVMTFDALAVGVSNLSFDVAQVTGTGGEIGACGMVGEPMTCTGGSITVQDVESLKLDFDISNGACVDIDAAATVTLGQSLDVGVCLRNTTANQVAAFQYRVLYDDTLIKAPEEGDAGNGHDDNPNANVGAETFTSATYPTALGSDWNCSGQSVGAVPVGDLDGILANGEGQAYSGACQSLAGPHQLTSGPLGVVTFNAVGGGVATLTIEVASVTDENLVQIGSCNPTDITAMPCTGGTINVQQGNGAINGKVYVNGVAPGNEFSGALVQANGAGNVVSDLAGNYSITGLPAGSYTLSANTQAPFTGANVGPVSLAAGQTLSGQNIIITGPTGGVTGTAYRDSAIPANVMAGAVVEACAAVCRTTETDGAGMYTVPHLPDGSYTLTLFPTGNYRQVSVSSVVVSGGTVVGAPNLVATPIIAPPAGTVSPAVGDPQLPVVFNSQPFTLTRTACAGGSASYTITNQNIVIRSGSMTEGPAGTYTAVVAPLTGQSGEAVVSITVTCPVGPPDNLVFSIYIDPAGFVRDMAGEPIVGATITLFRAENFYGPYIPVPNGSVYMSPLNRSNPDLTDATGHFRWDVAAGFYIVEASKPGCLLPEAYKRSAYKRSDDVFATEALTIPPPVTDLDLRLDCTPNPCNPNSPTNTDSAAIGNGPLAPGEADITIFRSDANNDTCDTDDDNDGLLDIYEGGFPVTGCPSATAPLGSLQMDTDGDRLTDGWECQIGSDPANPTSKNNGTGSADADGDRIIDLWEMRGYNGSGASTDSDGDGCHDLVELTSIDGNKAAGDPDRLSIARRALNVWGPEPAQDYVLDIDKNGVVGDVDRLFAARAVLLPDWLPKTCP